MQFEVLIPKSNPLTLTFEDNHLEREFRKSYDRSVRIPLRQGIVISILSWYCAIVLIYSIIPEKAWYLTPLTVLYIGSYFGFIVYATYRDRFLGWYHLLGAFSNAWAGLYTIYFCSQFPNGQHLILPVLIFIIFFGSYMVRLRWMAGFFAALSYIVAYQIYILFYAELSQGQILLYSFVCWMVLIFALLAGRMVEGTSRLAFIQRKTIREQSEIIEREKEVLLKEVHHRVHNNLQIIVSLINLQKSKLNDREVVAQITEMQSRILSMSLVHQRMKQTSNFMEISLKDYTLELIENLKYQMGDTDVETDFDIPDEVLIDIETAIPLGLILNEMAANFLATDPREALRKMSFKVRRSLDGKTRIHFTDNRQIDQQSDEETLSRELIEALAEQLDGKCACTYAQGMVFELEF